MSEYTRNRTIRRIREILDNAETTIDENDDLSEDRAKAVQYDHIQSSIGHLLGVLDDIEEGGDE